MTNPTVYDRLQTDIIRPGLCTGCGTCVALSNGQLTMRETVDGPQPQAVTRNPDLPQAAYDACPGKGLPYPALNAFVFGRQPENWLLGCYKSLYIGYAADEDIRRNGASGGVITRTLAWLLEQGEIDAAVVAKLGGPRPYDVSGALVTTPDEVYAAAQSIYRPVPVNTALALLDDFDGRVAYVGLPDQVASLRQMQRLNVPVAQKITLVLGPYTGTNMTFEAVRSYLRTQGVTDDSQIADLRYREGEWPGNLYIRLTDGREFRVAKFYYNYLIPFYITRTTLFSVDFANELTDISVGDAWNPKYEDAGQGFSVVVARTERGDDVLNRMAADGTLELDPTTEPDALAMHGHMIDFKKRGSFIRMTWRRMAGPGRPGVRLSPGRNSAQPVRGGSRD